MAEQHNINVKGMGDEVVKAIHGVKSYVGSAFITFILYYIGFYVIGLIANLIFLAEAKKTRQITGVSPSGRGCLIFLLWTHLFIPLLLILALIGVIGLPFLD